MASGYGVIVQRTNMTGVRSTPAPYTHEWARELVIDPEHFQSEITRENEALRDALFAAQTKEGETR
jgi:hypothetical protein